MESPIVTLTTDWGYSDYFAGMVKGRLYSSIPNVRVVDVTHGLEPFELARAIFVVRHACMGFPEGTIHVIDNTVARHENDPFVVVEHNHQYYICVDNGLPHAVFGNDMERAVAITAVEYNQDDFRTFAAYDIFCPIATQLAMGADLADLGTPLESLLPYTPIEPILANNLMKLYVDYIDDYGNAILNMTYDEFKRIRGERKFEMQVRELPLKEVVRDYSAAKNSGNGRGAALLTVSATGYLQVALRQYSAEQYFGLSMHDAVIVRFFDE